MLILLATKMFDFNNFKLIVIWFNLKIGDNDHYLSLSFM